MRVDRTKAIVRNLRSAAKVLVVDRALLALPLPSGPSAKYRILVAPPGAGNVGDSAMVEAALDNYSGPTVLICRSPADYPGIVDHHPGLRLEHLPALIYGTGVSHAVDLRQFRRLLGGASRLDIIGADIMDGAYNESASVARSTIAAAAARHGIATRVLGFSLNASPTPAASKALRRAGKSGVRLYLRDPVSLHRARSSGIASTRLAIDSAFAGTATDNELVQSVQASVGDRWFCVFNVSALIHTTFDQTADFVRLARHVIDAGGVPVFLPHVVRPDFSDISVAELIRDELGDSPAIFVPSLPSPGMVRSLTKEARFVVTGRMHLAIIALSQRTPAVALATQGKVEGLMEILGRPEWCVTPGPDFAQEVTPLVDAFLEQGTDLVAQLDESLLRLQPLAAANFED